jgi:hypothetical protein
LSLHRFKGTFDDMLNVNTPTLLPVRLPGVVGNRYLAIVLEQGGKYSVEPSDSDELISREVLRSLWEGEAWLVWRDGIGLSSVSSVGDRGDTVAGIQGRLKGAGFFRGVTNGIFGKETLAAVRAFQADAGLPVDGRVGPQTLIRLSQVGGMDDAIALTQEGRAL